MPSDSEIRAKGDKFILEVQAELVKDPAQVYFIYSAWSDKNKAIRVKVNPPEKRQQQYPSYTLQYPISKAREAWVKGGEKGFQRAIDSAIREGLAALSAPDGGQPAPAGDGKVNEVFGQAVQLTGTERLTLAKLLLESVLASTPGEETE